MTTAKIIVGDVRQGLATLPDRCVQTVVTSPPYWGLRDYGADGQIGLEETPQQFVAAMVEVFDSVWRVLADDGVLWLNLGDSYVGTGDKGDYRDPKYADGRNAHAVSVNRTVNGLRSKNLVGIPWRVAFALQEAGWYLRQDIIWAKPNPMPESVKDRCTKSHEYIFMLTKQARYYFNNEAISEPALWQDEQTLATNAQARQQKRLIEKLKNGDASIVRSQSDYTQAMKGERQKGRGMNGNKERVFVQSDTGRNKRDVWTVATQPFKGAHFAVMPEAIVEPCVRAASRSGDLVLDPFTGSGTVGLVALREDRRFVGCELNPEYAEIAKERIGPLLTEIV